MRAAAAEGGVCRKCVVTTLHNVPASQHVRLVNVRVDGHGAGAEEREAAAAKVGDFDTLEGDNRFRRDIEGGGAVAPDCEAHFVLGVIDEG